MIDKSLLKNTLLSMEREQLSYREQAYADYLDGARHDQSEPVDQDQASQSFGSSEIAQAFEVPITDYAAAIAVLQKMDFGPKDQVKEGAAVRVDGRWFVVAVATGAFRCDGIEYMGISTMAPIYAALHGAEAGDTVDFNGRTLKVQEVN